MGGELHVWLPKLILTRTAISREIYSFIQKQVITSAPKVMDAQTWSFDYGNIFLQWR